jgi:hypothetical protein
MVSFDQCCESLSELGQRLHLFCQDYPDKKADPVWMKTVQDQHFSHPWFIESFILESFQNWSIRLSPGSLKNMDMKYPWLKNSKKKRKVGVIPRENIPLSGLQDMICILLNGYYFYGRNDHHDLLKFITDQLISIQPRMADQIHWDSSFPKDMDTFLVHTRPENDTILKTYFEKKHSLFRQKKISIGIISPSDGEIELKRLAHDCFTFFGLDSHCVRKLFIPEGFSLNLFFEAAESFSYLYQYNRYANNYDYHHAVFLMDRIPFLENGFFILRESTEHHVPIGCIYYQYYHSTEDLINQIRPVEGIIQKIVTNFTILPDVEKPGQAHCYPLWEYDDHKDVCEFLKEI